MKIKILTSVSFVDGESYNVGQIIEHDETEHYSDLLKNEWAKLIEDKENKTKSKSKSKSKKDSE